MSKKSHFRGPIAKEHGKRAQKLLKSAPQHLFHIYWSLPRQLNWKKDLLLTWQILGLFAILLAANDKYPVLNSYKLMIPNQRHLSQKQNTFSQLFSEFLKSRWTLERLEKKHDAHGFCISEITDSENVVLQMSKKSRLRAPLDK